jgi:hypothetical protein
MVKTVSQGYSYKEQEVTMNYNQGEWIIYSSLRTYITDIMKKYGDKVEVLEQLENGTPVLVRVILDEDLITLRTPPTKEQRERRKEKGRELALKNGFKKALD